MPDVLSISQFHVLQYPKLDVNTRHCSLNSQLLTLRENIATEYMSWLATLVPGGQTSFEETYHFAITEEKLNITLKNSL